MTGVTDEVVGQRRADAEHGEQPVTRLGVGVQLGPDVGGLQQPEKAGEREVGVGRGAQGLDQPVEFVTAEAGARRPWHR